MKYLVLIVLIVSTVVLAQHDPKERRRDPVPAGQIVAHSIHCAGCHGFDPAGIALTDKAGNDLNMYDDWQVSMMALSAHDPFWRATLNHEVHLFPAAQAEIESTCLKCHAPLGNLQSLHDGVPYSYAAMLADSLGLDGVSCGACHQQAPETFGRSHSGDFSINKNRILYGPHPNPFEGPMDLYVGFKPVYTDLMYSSGLCAGCHTLITHTLDESGTPTGDYFVEQATYHEWLNSTYAFQGTECQTCHMPFVQDSIILATGLQGLEKRHPHGLHQFYGANTAMLDLMRANKDELNLPVTAPEATWEKSIGNNRLSLRSAARVSVMSQYVAADTLYVEVAVVNQAGHKLPSGYPSRLAWLQVVLTDATSGDTLYANGMMDDQGHINGRDLPYEPHHQISYSHEDVQIYELAMQDVQGHLTTRLNAAYRPLKDNRLLPAGFRTNHAVYDTVAIWGEAVDDPDYGVLSTVGRDVIEYRIPLHGQGGIADLHVALQYQTMPARWMQDLFAFEDVPEVAAFKSMYAGYERYIELIDSTRVRNVDLEASAISEPSQTVIRVFPNPVAHGVIRIESDIASALQYQLVDLRGNVMMRGNVTSSIALEPQCIPGVYCLIVTQRGTPLQVIRLLVI